MNRKDILENLKKIAVLVLMLSVGSLVVFIFENHGQTGYSPGVIGSQTVGVQPISTETTDTVLIENELRAQQSYYELDQFRVVEGAFEDGDMSDYVVTPLYMPIDPDGDILGVGGISCDPQSPQGMECNVRSVAFQPVCVQGSANVNFREGNPRDLGQGVEVTKNAVIEAWRITSPLAILSGIESMSSSDKAITRNNPVFRSSSDLIDHDYVAKAYMAPGQQVQEIDRVIEENNTENFSVHVQATIGGGAQSGPGPARAMVDKELDSACMDIQPSNPDVKVPNGLAEIVKRVLYGNPAKPIEERNFVDYDPVCVFIDPNNIDLPRSEVFLTCLNERPPWQGIVRGVWWDLQKRAQCLIRPEQCEKIEIFGLLIDAPFGKNSQCEEGSCADQYFDYSVASSLAPGSVNEYRDEAYHEEYEPALSPHYVTTPCKIKVDYGRTYDVPCLWDISPYYTQYLLERNARKPDDPDFMTFDEYWRMVEELSEARGAVCGV